MLYYMVITSSNRTTLQYITVLDKTLYPIIEFKMNNLHSQIKVIYSKCINHQLYELDSTGTSN